MFIRLAQKMIHFGMALLVLTTLFQPQPASTKAQTSYSGIRLPYRAGEKYRVYCDGNCHAGTNRHAVDFSMKYKDVLAIHSGVVVEAYYEYNDKMANHIVIDHQDGYCSNYFHLQTRYVSEGMAVSQGKVIAQSGDSGVSKNPHLHLSVTKKVNGQCSLAHEDEQPMIFDEHPEDELHGSPTSTGDTIVSQNTEPAPPVVEYKRIGFIDAAGKLSVKDGGLWAPWANLGGTVKAFQLEGDRVGVINAANELYIKDGALDSSWTNLGGPVRSFQLDGNRIAVLNNAGTLQVKEGIPTAEWTVEAGQIASFQIKGSRIGVLDVGGNLSVKEGGLGADWVHLGSGFTAFQLNGDRVGALNTASELLVKEGSLETPWANLGGTVKAFQLEGDRVGVINAANELYIKDGALDSSWTNLGGPVRSFQLDGNRIAVLNNAGTLQVKEGIPTAEWTVEAGQIASFQIKGSRIGVLDVGGNLSVKEGGLGADWVLEAPSIVAGFQLEDRQLMGSFKPSLTVSQARGAPGSSLSINLSGYLPNTTAEIYANGTYLGEVTSDTSGNATFAVTTVNADEGIYHVTLQQNQAAVASFILDHTAATYNASAALVFPVPSGISFWYSCLLPIIQK